MVSGSDVMSCGSLAACLGCLKAVQGFLLEPSVKELDPFPLFIGSTNIHSFPTDFDFLFIKRTFSGATTI